MDHDSLKHPGAQAVDRRVKVFWPEENDWFTGIVSKHDPITDKHTVTYDDGESSRRSRWRRRGWSGWNPG